MTHQSCLAGVAVGDDVDVVVMGALNVSPESFYGGSVATTADQLLSAAEAMARSGAALVDVGAMSTAPYLSTRISEAEEAERLAWAVEKLADKLPVPLSADTSRAGPARAALEAGARVINDVTGLTADDRLGPLIAQTGAGLILMASERGDGGHGRSPGAGTDSPVDPVEVVKRTLEDGLARARRAGIPPESIVIDPGIGFFRDSGRPWQEWDCAVLAGLGRLRPLGRPIAVGVSRKSFIGALTGEVDPGRRLAGSLAASAAAVLAGAHLVRTHDVAETLQAARVAIGVRRSAGRARD